MTPSSKNCTGFLLGNRVVVFDYECANHIYWNGYHGTFLGVYKPKNKNIQAPLELSIMEALYLCEQGSLKIVEDNSVLQCTELREVGDKRIAKFKALYAVYCDLKRRGFVVRRGLKFGCDYLAYRYGPGLDHAPFGVLVYTRKEAIDPIELVRAGRLLHSVRKKLIIASVGENNEVKYLLLNWWKP